MRRVLLSQITDSLESGSRPKGGVNNLIGEIPSLGAEHLNNEGGFDFKKLKLIRKDFYQCLKNGRIKRNDILVVKDGATTGKVSFVNEDFPYIESAINEHLFKIQISKKDAVSAFVFYFLKSSYGQRQILKDFRGATVGGISRRFVDKVEIPLPPLPEQKRIAAILDKADAIRRKRQQAIKLADEFLRATFLDMFGDPATNSKGWEVASLKDIGDVTTGNTPSRKIAEFYGNSIEWIKSDNINTPFHFLTKADEWLSRKGKRVGRKVASYATLVTCIAGSFDCIGNAALTDREVAFNQQINAITPKDGTDPFFLYCLILNAKKLIQNASTNSMKGMVSKGKFEQILLFNPPSPLQKEFGCFFQSYIEKYDNLRKSERLSRDLFNSLTQCAFRGEL